MYETDIFTNWSKSAASCPDKMQHSKFVCHLFSSTPSVLECSPPHVGVRPWATSSHDPWQRQAYLNATREVLKLLSPPQEWRECQNWRRESWNKLPQQREVGKREREREGGGPSSFLIASLFPQAFLPFTLPKIPHVQQIFVSLSFLCFPNLQMYYSD